MTVRKETRLKGCPRTCQCHVFAEKRWREKRDEDNEKRKYGKEGEKVRVVKISKWTT